MTIIIILLLFFVVSGAIFEEKLNADGGLFVSLFSMIVLMILTFFFLGSFFNHAEDLGVLNAQKYKISVYEEQREELQTTLESFNFQDKQGALLNQDSPIRSIVDEIGRVNKELANAKAELATAKISIEARKRGPFSLVVKWYGEK